MSDQPDLIKPKAVRLSHTGSAPAAAPGRRRKLLLALFLTVAAALIAALFVLGPRLVEPVVTGDSATGGTPLANGAAKAAGSAPPAASKPNEPPPFEALRRQQARTEAQDELARFVELEIELRDAMQVDGWGAAAYAEARELAHSGDESFVNRRHDQAIAGYRAAADSLAALIEAGHDRFDAALATALEAIDARETAAAEAALEDARLVKPEHPELIRAQARARSLPQVIRLFREAHNQELAGQWGAALATYGRIRAVDPETPGLDPAVATARARQAAQRLQSFLSAGFAQLANGHLDDAESSFRKALAMDPQNGAAQGGLQQIAEQGLVRTVERLRRRAAEAENREDWPAAAQAFEEVLALDANIQFARSGLTVARAQADTLKALNEIAARPEALSSDRVYADARATLDRATGLKPRGPALAGKIAEVNALLESYAQSVPVVLQSDNATEVLLSNVGPLGSFYEKQLHLRPGAYTLIGSRDGCRDVRTTITVRAEMEPVDIRCLEVLAR